MDAFGDDAVLAPSAAGEGSDNDDGIGESGEEMGGDRCAEPTSVLPAARAHRRPEGLSVVPAAEAARKLQLRQSKSKSRAWVCHREPTEPISLTTLCQGPKFIQTQLRTKAYASIRLIDVLLGSRIHGYP